MMCLNKQKYYFISECHLAKMKISYKFGIRVYTRYSISKTMAMFHKGTNDFFLYIFYICNV